MRNASSWDLGIQIVNYKTKQYLIPCITSILKDLEKSPIRYHIFVIDNDSGDDLSDLKEKYKNQPISFFVSERNGGFGYGHNLLAQKHHAKYILLVNPDIEIIQKGTIQRLYDYMEQNKKTVGSLGVKNDSCWDHGNVLPWNNFLRRVGISVCLPIASIKQVNWVQGSFFLVSKLLFDKIGGFDENYFLYKEEEDLQYRIENIGYKTIYNPEIKVFHHGGIVARKWKYIRKSVAYFVWKWLIKNGRI